MKKNILKKVLLPVGIFTSLYFIGFNSYAVGTGWCETKGGVKWFDFNMNYNLTDPSKNRPGLIIPNAYSWGSAGTYNGTCDCTDGSVPEVFYKLSVPPNLELVHSSGGLNYYAVNENLAAATEIFIFRDGMPNKYFSVPQEQVSNRQANGSLCSGKYNVFTSGASGRVSLYFTKAFVGEVTIPSTRIASLYASVVSGSFGTVPMSTISIGGTVTVPQSCRINDGAVIDVDFGNIISSSLATKGRGAAGYAKKVVEMAYICTNISEGVKLSFTFNGTPSPDDAESLATDNGDVGVRIEDMSGTAITPNSGKLSGSLDYDSQSGSTQFQAYPINTTGNQPSAGNFSSMATITTNME